VLRRLPGKAPKRRHIEIFLRFGNAARQDASAHKHVKLFLREPLSQIYPRRGALSIFHAHVEFYSPNCILFYSQYPEVRLIKRIIAAASY
jgi:hypothetical protein